MPSFCVPRHHHYCDCPSCRQFNHQGKIEGHDLLSLGREEKKGAEMGEQYFLEPVESRVHVRRNLKIGNFWNLSTMSCFTKYIFRGNAIPGNEQPHYWVFPSVVNLLFFQMAPLLLGFRDWRGSCYTSIPLPNRRADPKPLDSCTMRPLHPPLGLQIPEVLVPSLQPSLRPTSPPEEKCLPPLRWPSLQSSLLTIRDKMGVCLCSQEGHARGQGYPAY